MYDEIRDAFGQIHATDKMKRSVSEYLSGKEQKTVKSSFRFRPYALASACALLLIVAGVGNWYFWEMPVAYVSVDVNPSVELTLNRRNRVTDAEGLNQDGEAVLEHVQLEGKDYLEAVELLIESDAMPCRHILWKMRNPRLLWHLPRLTNCLPAWRAALWQPITRACAGAQK